MDDFFLMGTCLCLCLRESERERERERAFFGPKFRELLKVKRSRYESKGIYRVPACLVALFYFYFFKAEYFFYLFNIFLM